MAKVYAVRNGRHIGIYDTWEECKRQVDGFSGAEYKSFHRRADAVRYIGNQESVPEERSDTAAAYVDGSYRADTGEFAYGAVIFAKGKELEFSARFSDPEMASMHNVAGEIMGARKAMSYCAENGIKNLDLYYDYEGIEKWCTGEWKTNKTGTAAYKRFYDEIKKTVHVSFNKVKGHSGDKYNDRADFLAGSALGIE